MGRREQRAELESTWCVYEGREPGTPFTRKDIEDADELSREPSTIYQADASVWAFLARLGL
jgi:hypothetical protein